MFPTLDDFYKKTRTSLYNLLKQLRRSNVRSARGSRKRSPVVSLNTGRNIRTIKYNKGKNSLAPVPTIVKSILNNGYNISNKRLKITDNDLVGWHRTEYESLTLVLLVDVSKSTWPFIEVFKEILQSLTAYFVRHNDRVGMISLQGLQARIFNHPTHNVRVVARGLGKLKFHGETPLADGLQKSLNMAKIERTKNPGSKCLVILLSDCYPEPVARGCDNLFEDPAYKESLNSASIYKKEDVTLLVINPMFETEDAKLPGEVLAEKIVKASGGKLIKLIRPHNRRHLRPTRDEMDKILRGIETSMKH